MYAPLNEADGSGESAAAACSNLANKRSAYPGLELERAAVTEPTPQLRKGSCKSDDKSTRENADRVSQGGQSNLAQLQEENVLTVEAFLKSSTIKGRTTLNTYKRRKLRKRKSAEKGTRSNRDDLPRRSFSSSDGEDDTAGSHLRRGSKHTQRRENRRPLKERLYKAAISTNGNPDDYYTRSEAAERTASNRAALLKLIPDEDAYKGLAGRPSKVNGDADG
jgi:hypothetical protein